MTNKLTISLLFFNLILLSVPAWGQSIIAGQVVDADAGKPIANAAVYICWTKSGSGPPGLAGDVIVKVAETLTDAEGFFKIPKYSTLFNQYELTVYMNGYVCWTNRKIFPTYEKRKDFKLKDEMVIKLERFREEYSKVAHANFTLGSSTSRKGLGIFDTAIKSEMEIEREFLKRNRRK